MLLGVLLACIETPLNCLAMTVSPFQKIVFPAILASSAVFAALTLPLSSVSNINTDAPLPDPIKQWFSPLLQHEQKKVSIRYVGFSIISSVAAGVGTAELMRLGQSCQRRRQQRQVELQELFDHSTAEEPLDVDPTADQPIDVGAESDRIFGAMQTPNWLGAIAQQVLPVWSSEVDWEAQPGSSLLSAELASEPRRSALTSVLPADTQAQVAAPGATVAAEAPALLSGYQRTYRIQLPGSDQRVLAIQLDGEYYSFLRLRPTQEQAIALLSGLEQRGQVGAVTPHGQGYAVWVKQAQATGRPDWQQWQMIA
jgi:hypothetical protein